MLILCGFAAIFYIAFGDRVLPAENRQQQTQHNTDDDAGDDRKIKRGVVTLDPNVAGQSAKPFRRKPAPKNKAKEHNDAAEKHEHFPEVTH